MNLQFGGCVSKVRAAKSGQPAQAQTTLSVFPCK